MWAPCRIKNKTCQRAEELQGANSPYNRLIGDRPHRLVLSVSDESCMTKTRLRNSIPDRSNIVSSREADLPNCVHLQRNKAKPH